MKHLGRKKEEVCLGVNAKEIKVWLTKGYIDIDIDWHSDSFALFSTQLHDEKNKSLIILNILQKILYYNKST